MNQKSTSRLRCTATWLGLALIGAATPVLAQVYRSVDDAGHVTFSDQPPANAVEVVPVEIEPGPSEEEVRATRARVDAGREQFEAIRAARAAEEARARQARVERLEEEALRAAAQPPSQQPAPKEQPGQTHWRSYAYGAPGYPWYPGYPIPSPGYPGYPGYPVFPWLPGQPTMRPPPQRPEPPPRPKVLDSPLYNRSTSPAYR